MILSGPSGRALSVQRCATLWSSWTRYRMKEPVAVLQKRVSYHEACHLCHVQKVREQPRNVLNAIPGIQIGSPQRKRYVLRERGRLQYHAQRTLDADPGPQDGEHRSHRSRCVADGQSRLYAATRLWAQGRGSRKPVLHPVQLLDAAYRAGRLQSGTPATFQGIDNGATLRTRRRRVVAIAADGRTRVVLGSCKQ